MDKKIVTLAGATGYLGEKIAKELIVPGSPGQGYGKGHK